MKIYKLASLKQKIQQYKINDPFLIFFLRKYENLIPWGNINSSQDIVNYISSKLLPDLFKKIDVNYEGNNYLKDIDMEKEFRNNPNDPNVQQAWNLYRNDPEKSKVIILNHINEQKKRIFNSWINYFTKGNDVYADNPAFSYVVLKPIIDLSPSTSKKMTFPLNEMAVASLYEKIKNSNGAEDFRVDKQYQKEVGITQQKQMEVQKDSQQSKTNGWIRIPSKINDPNNFEKNINILTTYSIPNGWCTGSGMANPYLSKGDFYLYVVNGKAEVAIRMEGHSVAEIQGERNQRPFKYVNEIEHFVLQQKIDVKDNYHYNELMDAKKINEDIKDQEKFKQFISKIIDDPNILNHLSNENRKDPEALKNISGAILKGVMQVEEESTYNINGKLEYYIKVPEDIRSKLDDSISEIVIVSFQNTLNKQWDDKTIQKWFDSRKIQNYTSIAPNIFKDYRIESLLEYYINKYVEINPWKITNLEDNLINKIDPYKLKEINENAVVKTIEDLKEYDGKENPEAIIAKRWKEPNQADYRDYWKNHLREEYHTDFEEWEKNQVILDQLEIEDVREIYEVYNALMNAWCKYIESNIYHYEDAMDMQTEYTDFYENNTDQIPSYNDSVRMKAENLWHNKIAEDPYELDDAPEEIKYNYYEEEERQYGRHFTDLWLNYFLSDNFDKIDSYKGVNAINEMNVEQIERLSIGIINSPTAINEFDFDNLREELQISIIKKIQVSPSNYEHIISAIDINNLDDNLKKLFYNYKSNKEYWDKTKEQGQQELPFYDDVKTNTFELDDNGNRVPVYAGIKNWYILSKKINQLIRDSRIH
jgi:hypothetical protein